MPLDLGSYAGDRKPQIKRRLLALAEKLGVAPAIAYAMKAGTKECPPADLDWLRRLAAAHEATPRVMPEPDYRHVTLGPPTMEPQFQQDDLQTAERLATAIAYRSEVTPSPETDMDPNLVLTTLLDVYDEAGEEGGAAISEALSRLNLLDQARAILGRNIDKLHALAGALLEREILDKDEIDPFEEILEKTKEAKGVAIDTDLDADDLKGLVAKFKAAVKG